MVAKIAFYGFKGKKCKSHQHPISIYDQWYHYWYKIAYLKKRKYRPYLL